MVEKCGALQLEWCNCVSQFCFKKLCFLETTDNVSKIWIPIFSSQNSWEILSPPYEVLFIYCICIVIFTKTKNFFTFLILPNIYTTLSVIWILFFSFGWNCTTKFRDVHNLKNNYILFFVRVWKCRWDQVD